MPRAKRLVVPGFPHHVTQRGVRSANIFTDDVDRELYLSLMREHAEPRGVRFLAWCLMPNHVHLVVVPREADSLARGFGDAHRRYTRARATFARACAGISSRGASDRAFWTRNTFWRR